MAMRLVWLSILTLLWIHHTACLKELASDFIWAENIRTLFTNNQTKVNNATQLYISDAYGGKLWKYSQNEKLLVYDNSKVGGVLGVAIQTTNLERVVQSFGITTNDVSFIVYCVTKSDQGGSDILALVNGDASSSYKVVHLDRVGNGLDLHISTLRLYATTEGFFLPSNGAIYEVDILSKTSSVYCDNLYAADGSFIDQDLSILYVSQVIGSTMLAFDLKSSNLLFKWNPKNVSMIDDYCLTIDGKYLIAADFWQGNVVALEIPNSSQDPKTQILVGGLKNPTSVRAWESNSLVVTEGGGVLPFMSNHRVYQLDQNEQRGFVCRP